MNTSQEKHTYFNNLDALRFLSFWGVFIMHAWAAPETNNVILNFCIHLLSAGYFGVPFFFTLSSFLITYNLLVQKSVTGRISLAGFYRNRILRIWPVYFILVFFCFVLLPFISTYLHTAPASLPPAWPFLFFYVNFYIIHHGMGFTFALSILWSISIEEQFYLVWAPLMKLLKKNWLIPVIIVLSAISILFSWHYLYVRYQPVYNLHIHSIFVIQNFCAGAVIAIIGVNRAAFFSLLCRLPGLFWVSVYVMLPVCSFFINGAVTLNLIKSVCFGLIIFDQAFNTNRLFNAGRISVVNYLGKISYGLYMYHALIIVALQNRFHLFNAARGYHAAEAALAFILTFLVAHLSYQFIESRFLRLKSSTLIPAGNTGTEQ